MFFIDKETNAKASINKPVTKNTNLKGKTKRTNAREKEDIALLTSIVVL